MTDDPIPDDVKTFLLRYIDSIAQLEALLLLRANAELAWSADTLAKGCVPIFPIRLPAKHGVK